MILLLYLIGFFFGVVYGVYVLETWPVWAKLATFPIVLIVGYLIACGIFYKFSE